jgi:hypothetical protein
MPGVLKKTAMAVVGAIILAALIGGALVGPSLWFACFAVMLALGMHDWLQWRESDDMTAREVADRFMVHLLIFAAGLAQPTFDAFEAWLRT